jgi:putative DNA primase/helicase
VLDGSLREHDVGFYSTVQMKAKYDPEAKCPRFIQFLHSTLDEPEISLMQEIYGYFLVPITKAQKSFLLCGLPNVGKSTILTVLQEHLLGAENVSNNPLQSLSDRFQPAELFGKMANIFADLPNKKIDDASMFKAVTGEDYITGERKHKDPFSFKPFARFLYSCNDIPRNYGDRSEAFYRRLIIIRFSKQIRQDDRDFNLVDKLSLERDGILRWAIDGLKRVIANNYQFTETDRTKAEVMAYKIQNNSVLAFLDEMCVVEPGATSYRQEIFDVYGGFCDNMNLGRVSQPNFNAEIGKQTGIKLADDPVTRRAIFTGVKLKG